MYLIHILYNSHVSFVQVVLQCGSHVVVVYEYVMV